MAASKAAEIYRTALASLVSQFHHEGCTCMDASADCCAFARGDGWIAVTDRRSLEIETGKEYWVWGPAFRVPRKDHLIYGGNGPQWQYFANSAVTHCRPVVIPAPPAAPVAKEGRES